MNESRRNDLRRTLEDELSGVNWSQSDTRAVLRAVKEDGMAVKKKVSLALVLALALIVLTVGALAAAGVIFSGKVDAAAQADAALEKAYGITPAMQTYFRRSVEQGADSATVRYESYGNFHYVLGDYAVTVANGKATAAWSWDGTPLAEGFDAAPWGAAQLEEMNRISRETFDTSRFFYQALAIEKAAGIDRQPAYAPPTEEEAAAEKKAREEMRAEVKARMRFSAEALVASGREALTEHFGFTPDMLPYLTYVAENDSYTRKEDGKACLELWFGFGENEADGTYVNDTHPEWANLCGLYFVTIDVETGVIEEVLYDSALAGNG